MGVQSKLLVFVLGYGVFALDNIEAGTVLCLYPGDTIEEKVFEEEVKIGSRKEVENYIYTFNNGGKWYWYVNFSVILFVSFVSCF